MTLTNEEVADAAWPLIRDMLVAGTPWEDLAETVSARFVNADAEDIARVSDYVNDLMTGLRNTLS
jgi:hypothetical protein